MGKCEASGTYIHMCTSNRRKRANGLLTVAQDHVVWSGMYMGLKQTWAIPFHSFTEVCLPVTEKWMDRVLLEKAEGCLLGATHTICQAWALAHPHSERHQSILWPYLTYSLRDSFRNSIMSIQVIFSLWQSRQIPMAVTQTLAMAWLDTEVHIKTQILTDRAHYKFGEARECQLWKPQSLG